MFAYIILFMCSIRALFSYFPSKCRQAKFLLLMNISTDVNINQLDFVLIYTVQELNFHLTMTC